MEKYQKVHKFLTNDSRYRFFYEAVTFATYEQVPGDFLEFGIYGGRTLAMLARFLNDGQYAEDARKVIGFDSFEGLEEETEGHAVWEEGACSLNTDPNHPTLAMGEKVTAESVLQMIDAIEVPRPEIVVGSYAETVEQTLATINAAAIIHIDCDLYDATREVLDHIEPVLQPGTLIAFDDWFHYRGNPRKGEARAFGEFLENNPEWFAVPYKTYSVFCNSFIMQKRN